jgi:hypothetical protein
VNLIDPILNFLSFSVAESMSEGWLLGPMEYRDRPLENNMRFVEERIVPQHVVLTEAAGGRYNTGLKSQTKDCVGVRRERADSEANTMDSVGVNEADSEAETMDGVGVKEADSEAATKDSVGVKEADSEAETKDNIGVKETDSEGDTRNYECVIEFDYPADVPKELKPFYPRDGEVKQSMSKRFVFGRSKNVNVKLNDQSISREQFDIKLLPNPRSKSYELVLTNLSKTRPITLDNHELGYGQGRPLSAASTLLITDLDIIGAVKFIIKAHLPRHFSGNEFKVVFKQYPDFYEQLRSIQEMMTPQQHIGVPSRLPPMQTGLIPRCYPSVVTCVAQPVQQGAWHLSNSPPVHQYPQSPNPYQYPGFHPSGNFPVPVQGSGLTQFNLGPSRPYQRQPSYTAEIAAPQVAPQYHGYQPQQYRMPDQSGADYAPYMYRYM